MNVARQLLENKSLYKLLLLVLLRLLLGLSGCTAYNANPTSPFLGRFKVNRGPHDDYFMDISRGAGDAKVRIYNFVDFFKLYLPATVSRNSLIIPKQVFKNQHGTDVMIEGQGIIASDTLRITYEVTGVDKSSFTVVGLRVTSNNKLNVEPLQARKR
ncbi:hypothetical protein IC229_11740 [Spirosoma sp. BT702]|uniref:Uncharacterized protein n=1 Tax=Spirosoma profusum TaxID=2771354 RepID=A0A926Y0L1_9BACT|nr:hypothetical protein [Spirosoma profusum]MBD2701313.1 hypothetical protein [Spirosoma profusum]